jgi:hypothetical protein
MKDTTKEARMKAGSETIKDVTSNYNLFDALRTALAADYTHALDLADETLPKTVFLPGCTLSTYAAELTQTVSDFLQARQLAGGMVAQCCGKLLKKHGLSEEYQAYRTAFVETLRAKGVERVVVACPNCLKTLKKSMSLAGAGGLELVALPEALAAAGCVYEPGCDGEVRTVCVHDSSPDRTTGAFGAPVRGFFDPAARPDAGSSPAVLPDAAPLPSASPGITLIEMEHHHGHSRCCGSSLREATQSLAQCRARFGEFERTGASLLVTSCMSCVNSFQRVAPPARVRHYLELLFDISLDWQRLYQALDAIEGLSPPERLNLAAAQTPHTRIFGSLYP